MKEQENKELDLFVKKAVQDLELEKAPMDFNKKLFKKIELSKKTVLKTKPLISNEVWWVLTLLLVGLSILGNSFVEINEVYWLSTLKYNTIGNFEWLNFDINELKLNATIYATVGLTIFIVFQILILKKYFTKRRVLI